MIFKYERHIRAIEYALNIIRNSRFAPYCRGVYLFGSCARHTERFNSDIDLLLVVDNDAYDFLKPFIRQLIVDVEEPNIHAAEADLKVVSQSMLDNSTNNFLRSIKTYMIRIM